MLIHNAPLIVSLWFDIYQGHFIKFFPSFFSLEVK